MSLGVINHGMSLSVLYFLHSRFTKMSSKYTLLDLLHVQTAVVLSSGYLFSKRGYLEFLIAILINCRPTKSMESHNGQIYIFV